jgi:hypothetical protein
MVLNEIEQENCRTSSYPRSEKIVLIFASQWYSPQVVQRDLKAKGGHDMAQL